MNSAEYNRAADEVFPELAKQAGHADAIETSLYMAVVPGSVQLSKARDNPASNLNALGTTPLALRLWWSSYSKEGIYGTVTGSSQEKGEVLLAGAVKGLVGIFKEYYEKKIPARVDHH
jgi:creatinine amidohydrolase/Fe(II)-dependent formamide hydrolase-like protein